MTETSSANLKQRPHVRSHQGSLTGFLLHLHPRTVPEETLRVTLSFGLGGLAVMLLMVLFVTGLLQLLMYSPETATAYASILRMYTEVPVGGWIRNIHYWSGNLLVVLAGLHLLRVFLTGAIGGVRRLNWLIGLALLLLTLFANFTGYLLPWDQLAYWAATIFTSMFSYFPVAGTALLTLSRGGETIGSSTLSIFFAVHVGLLPLLFVIFGLWHLWLVRKAGGLICREPVRSGEEHDRRVMTIPALIEREAAFGLGLLAVLLVFSALVDAPLADPANPGLSPNPARGGWYLVGLQELLLHLHPMFATWVFPPFVLLLLAAIPFTRTGVLPGGVWCGGANGRRLALLAFFVGLLVTTVTVVGDDMLLRTDQMQPTKEFWNRGILPLVAYLTLLCGSFAWQRQRGKLTTAMTIMIVFFLHVGALLALTIVGVWFRGAGMHLVWPL